MFAQVPSSLRTALHAPIELSVAHGRRVLAFQRDQMAIAEGFVHAARQAHRASVDASLAMVEATASAFLPVDASDDKGASDVG